MSRVEVDQPRPPVSLYAAGPFFFFFFSAQQFSLYSSAKNSDKNIYNEREKNEIVEKQLFSVLSFFFVVVVCISFFFWNIFLTFMFFFVLFF